MASKSHGGPRPGAGRPVTTGKSPRIMVVLPAALRERMLAVRIRGETDSAFGVASIEAEVEKREQLDQENQGARP